MHKIDFDKAIWDKQPLLVKRLGKDSNFYKLFYAIFDLLKDNYLDENTEERSFAYLAAQLFVASASGKFLDEHGNRYGLTRWLGENDTSYRLRIKKKISLFNRIPSIDNIAEYVFNETGFVIYIEDSDLIGYINPDDAVDPKQAIISFRGDISRIKHIYYEETPELDIRTLIKVLDDIISPFVKYYLFAKT